MLDIWIQYAHSSSIMSISSLCLDNCLSNCHFSFARHSLLCFALDHLNEECEDDSENESNDAGDPERGVERLSRLLARHLSCLTHSHSLLDHLLWVHPFPGVNFTRSNVTLVLRFACTETTVSFGIDSFCLVGSIVSFKFA